MSAIGRYLHDYGGRTVMWTRNGSAVLAVLREFVACAEGYRSQLSVGVDDIILEDATNLNVNSIEPCLSFMFKR